MSNRLDPRPLFAGLLDGLRVRRRIGQEPADSATRRLLLLLPLSVTGGAIVFRAELSAPDALLAALALLIGAGLTMFSQVASWRERLTNRSKKIDGVASRALDEAVAHILAITVVAVIAAGLLISAFYVRVDIVADSAAGALGRNLAAAIVLGLLTYIALSLYIVINLLWDGYSRANPRMVAADRPTESKDVA